MAPVLEFYFRFWFWPYCRYLHVIPHRPTIFYTNWTIGDGVVTSYRFSRWREITAHLLPVWSWLTLKKVHKFLNNYETICTPNFDKIFQTTAEILLLLVSENKPPPCGNSTSDFHFDDSIVVGLILRRHSLQNFIRIRRSATESWRQPQRQNLLPVYALVTCRNKNVNIYLRSKFR